MTSHTLIPSALALALSLVLLPSLAAQAEADAPPATENSKPAKKEATAERAKLEAELMVELHRALPRRAPPPGQQMPPAHTIDWDQAFNRIGAVLARGAGTRVEPHALWVLGNSYLAAGRIDEALATLGDLKARFPSHPLVTKTTDDSGTPLLSKKIDEATEELSWRRKNPRAELPRPVVDSSMTATLHFSMGDVKLRFYENVAPKHRANFLKLAAERFYDRSRVHVVAPSNFIQLGDPNSKADDRAKWGRGSPGYTLPHEHSLVTHTRGTVTMFRGPGRPKSHGSQFQILLSNQQHHDFSQTAFATVIEGIDVVEKISRIQRDRFQAPSDDVFLNGITLTTSAKDG